MKIVKKVLAGLAVILAFTLCFNSVSYASGTFLTSTNGDLTEILSQVLTKVGPSVVGVIGKTKENNSGGLNAQKMPFGTGIIFKSDGYILTNSHVVSDMGEVVVVLSDGKAYSAQIKLNDEQSDLAILKIQKTGLSPVEFGDVSDIMVGESVIAIGTPMSFSLRNSATMGIISGLNRSTYGSYRLIQSDVSINGGNSGGPLVNTQGKVIGINSAKMQGIGVEGLSFSIPVDTIKYVLSHYEKYGEIKRPYLGAKFSESVTASYGLPSKEGLTITEVEDNSPAQKAGLAIDDVITELNGVKLTTLIDYNEETKKYVPGDTATLTVNRDGKTENIKVTFESIKNDDSELDDYEDNNSGGYAMEPDGSLSDLSFLLGGIGNTKVGHSFYGWSIDVPKSSQITMNTFNSKSVLITNVVRKMQLYIGVDNDKGITLENYFKSESDKNDDARYGKLVDSKLNTDADSKYGEFLYKMKRSGSVFRRIYQYNGYIYNLALVSYDEVNPANMKDKPIYNNIMDSFRLDFKGDSKDIKDLSKLKDGLVKYENIDTLSNYQSDKTWQIYLKPTWIELDSSDLGIFNTKFGVDDKENVSIAVSSFDRSTDLEEYGNKIKKEYAENYNPDSFNFIDQKSFELSGNKAYKLVYTIDNGINKYVYDENYIVFDKLIYKVTFKIPYENFDIEKGNYDKILKTLKIYNKNIEEFEKAVENNDINKKTDTIGKDASMTSYQSKNQRWSLKVPGNWTNKSSYSSNTLVSPNNDFGVYVSVTQSSTQKEDVKGALKSISALGLVDTVIGSFFNVGDSWYSYSGSSILDFEVTDKDIGSGTSETVLSSGIRNKILQSSDMSSEKFLESLKTVQTEVEGKFNSIEKIEAKDTEVTVYTYKYKNDKNDINADIKIYSFEKNNKTYNFITILPSYLSSQKNIQILQDIWDSFTVQG